VLDSQFAAYCDHRTHDLAESTAIRAAYAVVARSGRLLDFLVADFDAGHQELGRGQPALWKPSSRASSALLGGSLLFGWSAEW
jgi:hypothetical protein